MGARAIEYFHDPREAAAMADLKTKVIFLNTAKFPKLDPIQREFVIFHEHGHLVLNTREEVEADLFAFQQLMAFGYAPKDIVQAFPGIVNMNSDLNQFRHLKLKQLLNVRL